MKQSSIFQALPIVASHYGEMFGVKVAIGNWASTDGETITLPNISEEFAHKDVIWGLLAHESAHVKHTDFSVVKGMKSNEEFRFNMLNAIEDTRIESEMIDQFPGVRRDLEVVMDYMIQTGKLSPVSQNDTPGQIISAKVHYWGCSKLLQQQMMDALLKSADTAMEAKFTKGVCTRLEVLLRKMSQCRSTSDCLELTDNILAMLEDEAKKEEEKANNDDSSSNDKSSAGNDQDQNSDQNSSGSNDQGSDDDSQSGSNSKDDKSTPDQSDASNGADNQKQDSLSHGDKAKANQAAQQIREALNSSSDDLNEDAFDQLKAELSQEATQNGDDSYCTVPTAPDTAGNLSQGLKLLSDVKGTTSKIRAQLMGLVQATRQNRNWARRKGRRLCGNRMHRVMSGDLRVFKAREDRVEANTGVHVLTDLSSSMNASDAQIAREASLAIALALEAISGVSPAVTYFSGDSSDPVRSALRHGQLVRNNISHFIEPARGTTPMAEGIWFAAFELSKLREARKIIIVITDGSPDSSNACHKVIELCENSGIEMVGIGINTSRVEAFFNRSIMIENVDELRSTLFQLMRDKLTIEAA